MASSPELFRSALWASVPSQMIPFLREMFENLDPGGWHQMKTQRVLYKPGIKRNIFLFFSLSEYSVESKCFFLFLFV
jgi:hypothetical protein